MIEAITNALGLRPDEAVLARGGSFAEFQEVAIRAWQKMVAIMCMTRHGTMVK